MPEIDEKVDKLHKAMGHVHGIIKTMADHYEKLHKAHASKAEFHDKLSKAHAGHAEFTAGKADGMDDGDVNKAYYSKVAEMHKLKAAHHDELSKLHKEVSDEHAAHADALNKAHDDVGSSFGAAKVTSAGHKTAATGATKDETEGAGVGKLIQATTDSLVNKAIESLNNDPKVAERIQEIVLMRVNQALGDKLVPDHVRGVMPEGIRLVPREGGPTQAQVTEAEMSPEVATIFD